jgi:hypothetical protein
MYHNGFVFFIIILSYHIVISISQLVIGAILGFILFYMSGDNLEILPRHIEGFITLMFVAVSGVLFAYYLKFPLIYSR